MFDGGERKRLYKEARAFLKLRAQRNKWVRDKRSEGPAAPVEPVNA